MQPVLGGDWYLQEWGEEGEWRRADPIVNEQTFPHTSPLAPAIALRMWEDLLGAPSRDPAIMGRILESDDLRNFVRSGIPMFLQWMHTVPFSETSIATFSDYLDTRFATVGVGSTDVPRAVRAYNAFLGTLNHSSNPIVDGLLQARSLQIVLIHRQAVSR